VTKSPLDLWSQFEFLDPGILNFKSYYSFLNRHANILKRNLGSHSFQQIVGYKRLDELLGKIEPNIYRVLKMDCLDLPDKVYTTRLVELTDEQKKMYQKIQREAILLLDVVSTVTAPMVITQMLRLQQILSGHLKTDEGNIIDFKTNRLAELLNICDEVTGKILIYSRFRYDIITIKNKLETLYGKDSVGTYFGDTPQEERVRVIEAFEDPNNPMRFFIGNPSTAGYGITLNQANTVVYYANDFNLETRMQSEDRCHRIGQTNKVTYIDLITENTIDEKIVKALKDKIDIGAKVLGEEARQWLKIDPKQKTML
jgi:SNF2 family DNA or RNA helicase